MKVVPKLRSGDDLTIGIEFSVSVGSHLAQNMEAELKQILEDLGLADRVSIRAVRDRIGLPVSRSP